MIFDDEDKESLLERGPSHGETLQPKSMPARSLQFLPWALAIFFSCTTVLLALKHVQSPLCRPTFNTDFKPKFFDIEAEFTTVKFTNDLHFNATSQTFYNEPLDPNETQYIGQPTPSLDAAWKALLQGQYVAITTEEAQQFPEDRRSTLGGANYFELSVFHNLHCLNAIRMVLDKDHYKDDQMHMDRVHIDHCVDQIRQALQCHGDLTPVPMLPVIGDIKGAALGNGELHTCKNFTKIREWVDARAHILSPLNGG